MRKPTTFAIPVLAGLLLAATPAAAQSWKDRDNDGAKETERIDRTVQIRAGGQLRLQNFSGDIKITGSNRADVAVHAVRRASRERLNHIKLEIVETSSGVTIEANKKDSDVDERSNNVVETDFTIEVPADIAIDVNAFSSRV